MKFKLLLTVLLFFALQKGHAQIISFNDSLQMLKLCHAFGGFTTGTYTTLSGWNLAISDTTKRWKIGNPIANWYGLDFVTDGGGTIRVSKVNLGNLANPTSISGGIGLTNNMVVLTTNTIVGLDSLHELHLDSNNIIGGPFNIWGTNAANTLGYIDISGNNFTYATNFFQTLMGSLSSVKTLKARGSFNPSSVVGALSWPTNFAFLQVIDLGKNNIPGPIADLASIYFANLEHGYFDNNLFDSLNMSASNNKLSRLDVSNNKLRRAQGLERVLDNAQVLELLIANTAIDTTLAGPFVFAPTNASTASNLPKYVYLRGNKLSGNFNLNYFPANSGIVTLNIAENRLDSLIAFSTVNNQLQFFDASFNRLRNRLETNLIDGYSAIRYLYLNNNNLKGTLPAPANGSVYNWGALIDINLGHNPDITGDLRLDWILGQQIATAQPFLERIKLSNNDFENVAEPSSSITFTALNTVQVDSNRFHFDDLYKIAGTFGMRQVQVQNSPVGPTLQYIPGYWFNGGATSSYDTLRSFLYYPQDSAGIGGVRRRPEGDSVLFVTSVGYPQDIVHNVVWFRDSSSTVEIMGDVEAMNNSGGMQTGNIVATMTAPGVTVAPENVAHMIKISNLDSAEHSQWYIRAETKHDSFPLLMIPVRAKKLIVGVCLDSFNAPTYCQQIVVQYRDTTSYESKLRVRKELGVEVLDSCVCGSIELWAMPDTMNQIEMENLGSGTRTSAGQASSKAELLSADPNYALLDDTTGTNLQSPTFTVGNTEPRPTLVAIVDSGVDFDNPFLQSRIWVNPDETNNNNTDDDGDCEKDNGWGWNYLDRNNNTFDDHGHGTSVASVVGGLSTINAAYNGGYIDALGLVPYKYTDKKGRGTVYHAACGLYHAAQYRDTLNNGHIARVRVINTSWGYYGEPCDVLEKAIVSVGDQCDILIVASAGNDGVNTQLDGNKHWPSNSPFLADTTQPYNDNVIAVGSFDVNNPEILASYSNYSPKHIDILAAGTTGVYTTGDHSNLVIKNGTSFAAPQVSRVAGLLFHEFPLATSGAVKNAILLGVDTLQSTDSTKIKSQGRLNYLKARQILMNTMNPTLCDEDGFVVAVEQIPNIADATAFAKVYPNPFHQEVNIALDVRTTSADEPIDIQIVDISGKVVYYEQFANTRFINIPTAELPAAMYIMSIRQGANRQVMKLSKF